MTSDRILGLIFIAFGALALLSWLGGSSLIWLGALAGLFIYLYIKGRAYSALVAGSLLAGLTVGFLLGGSLAAIFLSFGVSFLLIDRLEPSVTRWALYVAATLLVLGVLTLLGQSGLLGSIWFALLLVAIGIFLLLRKNQTGWTYPRAAASPPAPAAGSRPSAPQPSPAASTPANDLEDTEQAPVAAPKLQEARQEEAGQEEAGQEEAREIGEADAQTKDAPPLSPDEAALYSQLERWRRQQAAEEAKPAYIILTNDSLLQIAREQPGTLDDLKRIKGIGPVKLERYGETILATVRAKP